MKYFYVTFPILWLLARDGNPFSIKGKVVNILDFVAHMAIQLHLCSTKAVVDNILKNGLGCVPIQVYLWTLK